MKYIFVIFAFIISLIASEVFAGQDEQDEYDDCLLKHLVNAKIDTATQIMKRACKENFRDITILSDNRRAYNECLLEYLSGVESGDAVIEIQEVCKRKHL